MVDIREFTKHDGDAEDNVDSRSGFVNSLFTEPRSGEVNIQR